MSNYCRGCHYDPEVRYGPRACPFNSLYWNFLVQHEGALARNPRMAQMYATWRKMAPEVQQALLAQAQQYLDRVNEL
jgi:deoxyribodipyrimidine photolyase-related protein